jgi:predicted ATPase/class 3 adenylate cyclase
MSALDPYLSQDRRWALVRNTTLPDRAVGAVLFADVSGFTPLTEAFTRSLGTRRGAEELTRQLNAVYDALIVEIENFGGSVISFAGDAALCWFPENLDASPRAPLQAVACAFALQRAMRQFAATPLPDHTIAELAIKVAVTYGATRRFVVGDANIRLLDVIAGNPVARSGIGEHLARRGEIVVDALTAQALGAEIEIDEWRAAPSSAERFAVLRALHTAARLSPPPLPPALAQTTVKPWLHHAVYKRLTAEDETFLTELRPVVALFARFQGIDFENDDAAGEKLDQFITRAQQILDGFGGALLELTIGDKGSYFYATFGAPQIHEDDARRAVVAARELFPLCHELGFLEPLQVGISQGVMRVGAYGSHTRRMYGAQGDEVNLAARLMSEAEPGALLVSGRIQKSVANEFDLEPLPPIRLKGKTEPLLPFLVVGVRETRVKQLQEAYYSLPMIGREPELALIQSKIELARRGQGQIIAITAPAGIGKSRMTAEIIRLVRRRHESSYGGECQSFGVNISYLVWGPVLRAFFGLDTNLPLRRQIRALESEVAELTPERLDALPLLGAILDVSIPENDFTRALEPEFRKTVLHALLRDCLATAASEARAQGQAILFVLEDIHWIDPASRELLQDLAAGIENLPIVFLLNFRPSETAASVLPQIEPLPFFTRLALAELTDAQGEGLIRAKLAQHAPESSEAVPHALIERVNAQAQGNPFYIEQLLDYMHDRGLDFRNAQAAVELELPNTLHRLVLTRLEQLNEPQQLTLKAASIIGRWFSFAHLCGYYPALGAPEQVRADLTLLLQYDLTALDRPDPDLAYVFKHVVTHQVAYEALAYATRAKLHEAYAQFLERHNDPERVLDLLAYHYDRSENVPKRLEYLTRAGQAAAARFANAEAVDYLTRALALTTDIQFTERYTILSARARVFDVTGERNAQRADLDALEDITQTLGNPFQHLSVLLEQGWLAERLAEHETARAAIRRVQAGLTQHALAANEHAQLEIEVRLLEGVVLWQQGNVAAARPYMKQALELADALGDRNEQSRARGFFAQVLREMGDYTSAEQNYKQLLEYAHSIRDKRREWSALTTLGLIANARGDFASSLARYTESLNLVREIGDRQGEGLVLSNLAQAHLEQGSYDRALEMGIQARAIANAIGDRRGVCRIELNLGETFRLLGQYATALAHTADALTRATDLEDLLYQAGAITNTAAIQLDQRDIARAQNSSANALRRAHAIHNGELTSFALNLLGQTQLALGELAAAQESFMDALTIWQTLEPSPYRLQTHAGLAEIALRQNDFVRARAECDAIFEFLKAHPNRQGDPSALAALLTCYRVLFEMNDANARAVLDDAYAQLQTRAEKISNAQLRQSFLENVPANAEIARAWKALQS